MARTIQHAFLRIGIMITLGPAALGQKWELGGEFGFGMSDSPAIANPSGSIQSGFRISGAASVVFAANSFQYVGGECRYTFRSGGPKLRSDGTQVSTDGYASVLTYDILLHLDPRESRVRPYFAAGSGLKIYTASARSSPTQPLAYAAILVPGTQVEPVISTGGGLKYLVKHGIQLRVDFRFHITPLPNDLIRPTGRSAIHGWTYDLLPMVGVSYAF